MSVRASADGPGPSSLRDRPAGPRGKSLRQVRPAAPPAGPYPARAAPVMRRIRCETVNRPAGWMVEEISNTAPASSR